MKLKLVDIAGSRQLALSLFLGVAVLALYGSLFTPEQAELIFFKSYGDRSLPAARFLGLIDTYRSPVFLALLCSLAANLLVCTSLRFFRTRAQARHSADRSRGAKAWLDLLLHLSILVILAGGASKGIWGATLTKNFYVGLAEQTAFAWRVEAEVPLGFTVLVKDRVDEYYPVRARVGIQRADSGEKIALLEILTEAPVTIPGFGAALRVEGFDEKAGRILFEAAGAGNREEFALQTKAGPGSVTTAGPFTFTLVAFRRDLKAVRSLIEIVEDQKVVAEQWLGPNARMRHRGTSIFQTAWGVDPFGSPYIGLQFVRDPGAPVFWLGCILLSGLLPVYLYLRSRNPFSRNWGAGPICGKIPLNPPLTKGDGPGRVHDRIVE